MAHTPASTPAQVPDAGSAKTTTNLAPAPPADPLLNTDPTLVKAPGSDLAHRPRGHRRRRTTLPRTTRGWSRGIVWTLIGLTSLSAIYGAFGRMDSTITATGKLRPVGGITSVNSPIATVVQDILVKEGDQVKPGQPLLVFDQEALLNQRRQLEQQQRLLRKERNLLARQLGLPVQDGAVDAESKRELAIETGEVELRRRAAQAEEGQARIALQQQENELAGLREKYALNANILERMTTLVQQGGMSQLELDRNRERQIELRSTIARGEQEILAARQRLLQSGLREQQVPVANLKQLYSQYDSARQQLADVTNRLIETNERLRLGKLLAPIGGMVFDISVKPGELPRGDKPLLKIVPENKLEAELFITNQDIGHLEPDMPVDVRVNSFPFTEYGSLKGRLSTVSADAQPATQAVPQEHFVATAKLDSNQLQKGEKKYNLRSGMAVTGMIKIGTRPVLAMISDRFNFLMDSSKSIR